MNISTASVLVPAVSQSHPYPPGNPPSPASRSDPGSYKVRPFVMGPGAFESLCAPSPSIELLFYQLLCSSRTPALFGHQMAWTLPYWMPVPQAEDPDMGLRILTPVGEYLLFSYSPVCDPATQVVWDLIISWMHPLQLSNWVSSLCFWMQNIFFIDSSLFIDSYSVILVSS